MSLAFLLSKENKLRHMMVSKYIMIKGTVNPQSIDHDFNLNSKEEYIIVHANRPILSEAMIYVHMFKIDYNIMAIIEICCKITIDEIKTDDSLR